MTTKFNDHRPEDFISQESAKAVFEEVRDKHNTLQTYRLVKQGNAVHTKTYYAHLSPTSTGPTFAASTNTAEQQIDIKPSDIPGKIKSAKLRFQMTASASTAMYPQVMVDEVEWTLPGGVTYPKMSRFSIASEAVANVNDEDLYTAQDSLGFDGTTSVWDPITCNTTVKTLIDVSGPLRGQDLVPAFMGGPINLRYVLKNYTAFMDSQTITSFTQHLIVEYEIEDDEEMEIIKKRYKEGFQMTTLMRYPATSTTVSGTTELNSDLDMKDNVAFLRLTSPH